MATKEYRLIVDSEVHQTVQDRRENVDMTENDVLRKLLNLPRRRRRQRLSPQPRKSRTPIRKKLRVSFSDGTVLHNDNVTQTFVESIEKIGPYRVFELGIPKDRGYLIEKQPRLRSSTDKLGFGWIRLSNGYFANIHCATVDKRRFLERIRDELREDFHIELVEG